MNDITISHGHHLIQFGGIFQRLNSSRLDLNTANFSYSTLSDFQANIPSSVQITFDVPTSILHTYQMGAYVHDDYRITPNLTLNLGVRYDVFTVPKERDGRLFNRGVDPNRPYLGYGYGPYRPASSIFNGDFNNFQPRVGFAWSLGSKSEDRDSGRFWNVCRSSPPVRGNCDLNGIGPECSFPFHYESQHQPCGRPRLSDRPRAVSPDAAEPCRRRVSLQRNRQLQSGCNKQSGSLQHAMDAGSRAGNRIRNDPLQSIMSPTAG